MRRGHKCIDTKWVFVSWESFGPWWHPTFLLGRPGMPFIINVAWGPFSVTLKTGVEQAG